MAPSHLGELECLPLDRLGQGYRRYRLPEAEAEADMAGSLRRYGQLTPLVVCLREETYQILDGFRRHAAAITLAWKALGARLYEADERAAKAAIYGLNRTGRHTQEWGDARIVHAPVREDGLTRVEVAELLDRHKSWVCRRLALVEKLADAARDDLRLGLPSATAARALVRLPRGNQTEPLAALHREERTPRELDAVVDPLGAAAGRSQQGFIPGQPRRALEQARQEAGWAVDPRPRRTGNRVARRLVTVLDGLGHMETWLRHPGEAGLTPCDRSVLRPGFARLAEGACGVAALTDDLIAEFRTHDRADAQ